MGASASNTPDVLEALRKGILSGEYLPSQTLTEASLCAHFGASRTTVKKALLLLEKEGLVSIEPNKSARVRAFTPQEVLELLEVRLVLERFVVRDAAAHITPRQLDALEQLTPAQLTLPGDSMSAYEIYPIEGFVTIDGNLCRRFNFYDKEKPGDIAGIIFYSGDMQHTYRMDVDDNTIITELK